MSTDGHLFLCHIIFYSKNVCNITNLCLQLLAMSFILELIALFRKYLIKKTTICFLFMIQISYCWCLTIRSQSHTGYP